MKRTILSVLALSCVLSTSALGSIVYNNTTPANDTGDDLQYGSNTFSQLGDQIHLGGTDRLGTTATVEFFNLGSAGTFDATLRLFGVGSPVGAQVGSDFTIVGISAVAADIFDVAFTLPGLLLPDDLIFTVSIANQSAGVQIIGLEMYAPPPATGSSDASFAIANDGTNFVQTATVGENVFFELQATSVPEPATIAVGALGLLALMILRKHSA